MLEKTKGEVKNGQSSNTGNTWHKIQSDEEQSTLLITNNPEKFSMKILLHQIIKEALTNYLEF